MLEAGDSIRRPDSSVSSAPPACVISSKPQGCFPIREMGLVGPGHILLMVGTRLPFRWRPRMNVLCPCRWSPRMTPVPPETLSLQTREAWPPTLPPRWTQSGSEMEGLAAALIKPGFPSFPQACILGSGCPVTFPGGHPECPCGSSAVHVPVLSVFPSVNWYSPGDGLKSDKPTFHTAHFSGIPRGGAQWCVFKAPQGVLISQHITRL